MPEPETLPFAKKVPHYALIDVIQDGVRFDKIRADTLGGVSQSAPGVRVHG
jgi:hypothetical protein